MHARTTNSPRKTRLFSGRFGRALQPMLVGAMSVLLAFPAIAWAQPADLGITDQQSYDDALDAIASSQYVRLDYLNNPRPRVPASVAALMEYATRNPLADEATLDAFIQAYATSLATAIAGDPDLRRGTNLMAAVHYMGPIQGNPALDGTDTNVGAEAAGLLGMGVPEPFDFDSLQRRTVEYEIVRERPLGNAPQLTNLLVTGFLGKDLDGNLNAALAGALQTFLENEGYEPIPDGVDDERFDPVNLGLAMLPGTYAEYVTATTVPGGQDVPPIWTDITDEFVAIEACTDVQVQAIMDADESGPTFLQGVERRDDPNVNDQLEADFQSRLAMVAPHRTILAANTLLMAQNADPSIRNLARQTQTFECIVLDTHDEAGKMASVLGILGGVATIAAGVAVLATTGVTGVGIVAGVVMIGVGVAMVVGGASGLSDDQGDGDAPASAEQQILDQVIEVRRDVENLRVQMNRRFDRIESQLNIVYQGMSTGFNAIGMLIGELSDTVDNIKRDVMVNRAALARIEDALYGTAQDLLEADLALWANDYLNYRGFNGVDLPYSGSGGDQSFLEGSNEFFTMAVDIAKNETYAGPNTSTLTLSTAETLLGGDSIGRNINDLRTFPTTLNPPLPALTGSRVVSAAPWAQGAAAYVQFARENPWYFAYQYEQQLLALAPRGGPVPDIDRIVGEGETLALAAANARNQALFTALFDGYLNAVDNFEAAYLAHIVAQGAIPSDWTDGVSTIDPVAGAEQVIHTLGVNLWSGLENHCDPGFGITVGAGGSEDHWGLLRSALPIVWSLEFGCCEGLSWCAPSSDKLEFLFLDQKCGVLMGRRTVEFTLSDIALVPPYDAFFYDHWMCDGTLREALTSGKDLTGTTLSLPACGAFGATDITFTSDVIDEVGDFCFGPNDGNYADDARDELGLFQTAALDTLIAELQQPGSNLLKDAAQSMSDWKALIEAYVTLSMPFAMESSTVLRSALRANVNEPDINGCVFEEFDRRADDWLAAAPRAELFAFDQKFPGVTSGDSCLDPVTDSTQLIELEGGNVRVRVLYGDDCSIEDGSTSGGAVSDLILDGGTGTWVEFEFDPPVCAFYTYYGSLEFGEVCYMDLYDQSGTLIDSLTSDSSTDSVLAFGHGFTSDVPIAQVRITQDFGFGTTVGSFVGHVAGEPSLGTVNIPGYPGPQGEDVLYDFGCQFMGKPNSAQIAMHGDAILPLAQHMRASEVGLGSIAQAMRDRAALAKKEIDDAIAAPVQGHPYLEFMLAELRDLRDNAFELATPDMYATDVETQLIVNVANGVQANDVDQSCRTIEVDLSYGLEASNGVVSMNPDGSFTYMPDPGFAGVDSFVYRTGADISGVGCVGLEPDRGEGRGDLDLFVLSNPVTVVIQVGSVAPACDGDSNGDGVVNSQDISFIIFRLGDSGAPGMIDGDVNADGEVNSQDISYVIFRLDTCP